MADNQWVQGIIKALKECDWFLVVLSPSSVDAKYVRYEVTWALDHMDNGRIIPVLHQDCEVDRLHFGLPSIQHIDFSSRQERSKSRAALLKRWGVEYAAQSERNLTLPAPPATSRPRKQVRGRPKIVMLSALALVPIVALVLWLGRRPARQAAPVSSSAPANAPAPLKNLPALSDVDEQNRLLIATLPGLNGDWWFNEARWLAPAFRAAALSAPAGTFDAPIDAWGPQPAEVYEKLRLQLSKHVAPVHARWGWLIPAEGASPLDDPQLTKMETKVSADTKSFKASDWHTLATIRHHLASTSDDYVAPAEEAYNKAIEAYQQEGEKRLGALCRSDFAWFLIVSNFDALTVPQIDLAESQLREIGPAAVAKSQLFLAYLNLCKANAYEDLFDWVGEAHCLTEADRLLKELGPRSTPHPLEAAGCEQMAWLKMWAWDVRASASLFAKAKEIRAGLEGSDPLSYLEKLNDQHGEAVIERFLGHSRQAQTALRAIVTEIDGKLNHLNSRNDAVYYKNLIDHKFNCLERVADCDLFDNRPAEAIKSVAAVLGFARESSLFNGGDRSNEVRLHSKHALAYSLAGDFKNADSKIRKALALTPKKDSDKDVGDEADVDSKARLFTDVIADIVDLTGDGHDDARDNLREILRTRDENLDCDTHELFLLAAQLLTAADRDDPDTKENAEEDSNLLFALIKGIPQNSRDAIRGYLGRYYEAALSARLDDTAKEIDGHEHRWALETWLPALNAKPPADKTLLQFFFEDHKGHAVLCPPDQPAHHFPLKVGRLELGKPDHDRQLPHSLVSALKEATVLVYWRPPSNAPDTPFPFDPPSTTKFEFPAISETATH